MIGVEAHGRPGERLKLRLQLGDGCICLRPPTPVTPFWRDLDGGRHSYGSLRWSVDPRDATALRESHLAAIHEIATVALEASERGDQSETVRLASAAARLCGEIRGLWAPSAVEVPKR